MIKVKIKNNSSQQTLNYQKRKGPQPRKRMNSILAENRTSEVDREGTED